MNTLLAFNFGDSYLPNLSQGLMVFCIGMLTVFSVLAIILALLSLFNVIFSENKAPKAKESAAPAAAVAPTTSVPKSNEDEIVAVIAAAIAAAESESAGAKFRVVSFKRK